MMVQLAANPSDLSKMMRISGLTRRQINHFAHYLPRQGVGTAYMLRGSAQLEHISAVFGYSGLINSQDRYEEEFSLYMGYFI